MMTLEWLRRQRREVRRDRPDVTCSRRGTSPRSRRPKRRRTAARTGGGRRRRRRLGGRVTFVARHRKPAGRDGARSSEARPRPDHAGRVRGRRRRGGARPQAEPGGPPDRRLPRPARLASWPRSTPGGSTLLPRGADPTCTSASAGRSRWSSCACRSGCPSMELDSVARGAPDPDLERGGRGGREGRARRGRGHLQRASRRPASAASSPPARTRRTSCRRTSRELPRAILAARETLRQAGVSGPYALVLDGADLRAGAGRRRGRLPAGQAAHPAGARRPAGARAGDRRGRAAVGARRRLRADRRSGSVGRLRRPRSPDRRALSDRVVHVPGARAGGGSGARCAEQLAKRLRKPRDLAARVDAGVHRVPRRRAARRRAGGGSRRRSAPSRRSPPAIAARIPSSSS